jgi:polar amino acid transport system permease protein
MSTFNFTPYVAVAVVFLVVTLPLGRLTDWLVARERGRRQGGVAAADSRRRSRARA